MQNIYEKASQILSNLKFTSDNVDMIDCYYLCANKDLIEDLKTKDPQVIWGRRGTGKTTLLKAFTYDINLLQQDPSQMAFYIVMSNVIPTENEIESLSDDGGSLAVYVFIKLIAEIIKQLEKNYDLRQGVMEPDSENKFLNSYYTLSEYINKCKMKLQGCEITFENSESEQLNKEATTNIGLDVKAEKNYFTSLLNFVRGRKRTSIKSNTYSVSGQIQFKLDGQEIKERITEMLDAFNISTAYICLDEYSEIDKVSTFSIQSKVAQLIKQVFFKNSMYSVKIATIWNRSKLHSRGGNRIEGIEYQQDIFAGPDLDIMFMENNIDIINYFKEMLVNTYLMGLDINLEEKKALSDYFENYMFGKAGLRHIICGSQGVSRSFAVLIKEYLKKFIKNKNGILKLGDVYQIIKHHYLEDVRNKIPYFKTYNAIEEYIKNSLCRYFLITKEDYDRCKTTIKYLSSKGLFMQVPGHLTDIQIRDKYKLFIIHYGNYLDALESASHKTGRKKITDDAKLEANGMLIPDYDRQLITNPKAYTISIPKDAEFEEYCTNCRKIFQNKSKVRTTCPHCGDKITRFDSFVNDVAL